MNRINLHVGDWVKDATENNNVVQLKSGADFDKQKVYEGVPLDEDILKRIFENSGRDYTSSPAFWTELPDNAEGHFGISVYEDGYFLTIIRAFKHGQVKKFVTYVHELQQALRLCELNDIADNIKL